MLRQLLHAIPDDVQGWQRLAVVEGALGDVIRLRSSLPLAAVYQACRAEHLVDSNRRQRCEALQAMLQHLQDTDLAASAAATLQRRLVPDGPGALDTEPRLRRVGERMATLRVQPPRSAEAAQAACRAAETLWRYHDHAATEGDLAATHWLLTQP